MDDPWVELFCNPRFRKAWENYCNGIAPTEKESDDIVCIYGRLMAAESRMPLPYYSTSMSHEMERAIRKCGALMDQMATAQIIQTLAQEQEQHGFQITNPGELLQAIRENPPKDMTEFLKERGVVQGDKKDP